MPPDTFTPRALIFKSRQICHFVLQTTTYAITEIQYSFTVVRVNIIGSDH